MTVYTQPSSGLAYLGSVQRVLYQLLEPSMQLNSRDRQASAANMLQIATVREAHDLHGLTERF